MTVTARDVKAARAAVETVARRTPMLSTRTFSERAGGTVVLKAENLQRTGSFKVRGVAAKLAALGERLRERRRRGQRGQPRARRSPPPRRSGIPVRGLRARRRADGEGRGRARARARSSTSAATSVDECLVAALERAEAGGLAFVHPFDDPAIVAGQGSLGLELLEDVPDLGAGRRSRSAAAACAPASRSRSRTPSRDVKIIGVQAAACAPYPESMQAGTPIEAKTALTIADGIAVKRPGGIPLAILRTHLDDLVVVDEEATAAAMALLLERCKLVVEGAGAVGIAALLGGQVEPVGRHHRRGPLGGNVDAGLLAAIARRHETEAGRRLVALTRIPDRPGGLATLLAAVAGTGANIVDVSHVREGLGLHVRETAVEMVLETRGRDHAQTVLTKLQQEGYETQVIA